MNLIILSPCNPVSLYLIQRLRSECHVQRVIRPIWGRKAQTGFRWSKVTDVSVSKVTGRVKQTLYNWYNRRLNKEISQLLFGSAEPPSLSNCDEVPAWAINEEEFADSIRSLDPDFLVVSGAPILKPVIFSIPKTATLNVHYGIAPYYRGENTIFWPLYLGDYENIGVTLHYVDNGIDTGNILAQGYPSLERGDTEATLSAKCARLAAELVVDFFRSCRDVRVAGRPQKSEGRLFYRRDRKLWRDIHYFVKRRLLSYRPPCRPLRKVRYF